MKKKFKNQPRLQRLAKLVLHSGQGGEIATILTVAVLLVIGATTFISSLALKDKKTTSTKAAMPENYYDEDWGVPDFNCEDSSDRYAWGPSSYCYILNGRWVNNSYCTNKRIYTSGPATDPGNAAPCCFASPMSQRLCCKQDVINEIARVKGQEGFEDMKTRAKKKYNWDWSSTCELIPDDSALATSPQTLPPQTLPPQTTTSNSCTGGYKYSNFIICNIYCSKNYPGRSCQSSWCCPKNTSPPLPETGESQESITSPIEPTQAPICKKTSCIEYFGKTKDEKKANNVFSYYTESGYTNIETGLYYLNTVDCDKTNTTTSTKDQLKTYCGMDSPSPAPNCLKGRTCCIDYCYEDPTCKAKYFTSGDQPIGKVSFKGVNHEVFEIGEYYEPCLLKGYKVLTGTRKVSRNFDTYDSNPEASGWACSYYFKKSDQYLPVNEDSKRDICTPSLNDYTVKITLKKPKNDSELLGKYNPDNYSYMLAGFHFPTSMSESIAVNYDYKGKFFYGPKGADFTESIDSITFTKKFPDISGFTNMLVLWDGLSVLKNKLFKPQFKFCTQGINSHSIECEDIYFDFRLKERDNLDLQLSIAVE